MERPHVEPPRSSQIKSTLSAVPTHLAICQKLPPWMIKAMHKIMKAFLWTGTEDVKRGTYLVAWSSVQRPLHLGGLGVLDPLVFGRAFLWAKEFLGWQNTEFSRDMYCLAILTILDVFRGVRIADKKSGSTP